MSPISTIIRPLMTEKERERERESSLGVSEATAGKRKITRNGIEWSGERRRREKTHHSLTEVMHHSRMVSRTRDLCIGREGRRIVRGLLYGL